MPRAFTDTQQLTAFSNRLLRLADEGVQTAAKEFMADRLDEAADWMYAEAPVDEGELRRSITVEVDGDGMGGSVGPTATDEKGRPYPFFVEHGRGDVPPNPFVLRTRVRLERAIKPEAEQLLRELFG